MRFQQEVLPGIFGEDNIVFDVVAVHMRTHDSVRTFADIIDDVLPILIGDGANTTALDSYICESHRLLGKRVDHLSTQGNIAAVLSRQRLGTKGQYQEPLPF